MALDRWRRGLKIVSLVLIVWAGVWLFQTVPLCIPRFIFPRLSRPDRVESMTVTAYCHCGKCCSYTDVLGVIPLQKRGRSWRIKHVGVTASGELARYGTIAADPALYPFGTIMKVPGYGYGVVLDTGGAINGQHIDVYYPSHRLAKKYGRRTVEVKVWE